MKKDTIVDMKLEFKSGNAITVTDAKGVKLELKDAVDVLKKGSNVIRIQITERGYIVEVNEKPLQDYNPSDKKDAELAVSEALETVSVIKVSKLTAKAKNLVIGSTRYE